MIIRQAREGDAARLAEIYGWHVLNGFGTFEEDPPDPAEMARRLAAVQAQNLPWRVAEKEGRILGHAYASPFRTRPAYRFTLEDSVYVAADAQRRGVGRAALSAVLQVCEARGFRQMLALIGDSGNAGSIGLHVALGFAPAGVMRDVGYKAGRWVDVVVMQKGLAPA